MSDDIVKRLRDQGKDAFALKYSLGMFKLCDEAADEIEWLREALSEIAEACEKAAHPAAEICLSEAHLNSLLQIAAKARSVLRTAEG